MRKDVKRSLVVWPMTAAFVTIAICWFGLHGRAFLHSKSLPRQAAVAAIKKWVAKSETTNIEDRPIDRGDSDALSKIDEWADFTIQIEQPALVGIPATENDLVGPQSPPATDSNLGEPVVVLFPVSEASDERQSAVDPPTMQPFDVTAATVSQPTPPADLDPEVQPEADLFFADEKPLGHAADEFDLETGMPGLAERPTNDIALPPIFERPSPAVADLDADSVVRDTPENAKPNWQQTGRIDIGPRRADDAAQALSLESSPKTEVQLSKDAGEPSRPLAGARASIWPRPARLLEQLDLLNRLAAQTPTKQWGFRQVEPVDQDQTSAFELERWSDEVRSLLQSLESATRLGDDQVRTVLVSLRRFRSDAFKEAELLATRSEQVALLQAAYAVDRRLAIWEPIYLINSGDFPATQHVTDANRSVTETIQGLRSALPETGDQAGWSQFLLVDQIESAASAGDDSIRRDVAQRFMSRLNNPELTAAHRDWMTNGPVGKLKQAIRPWASGAIDYSALLHQIEKAEANTIDLVTTDVAQSINALRFASHPQAMRLANNLDTHYRNANVRLSISDELLENLLPEIPARDVPVRTTLLGSRVTGMSRVSTDLRIRIKPSKSTWEMTLDTIGNVATRSIGRRGPAAVSTSSVNPFNASMSISIKPDDIQVGQPNVNVGGRARLRGINTTYDSWPLIGNLVQSFAESEYMDQASLANRIGRNRIRKELGSEINRTINEKVDAANQRFNQSVLGPLTELQLAPQVIDMSSSETRLIARYRMAGEGQLAAMTPRPRALADNLMSMQVHQSAINNTLEQLVVQETVQPIADVMAECYQLLGIDPSAIPDDIPDDTSIQFANHRPITVEIEDGRVWITMRIIRLQRDRLRLSNFIVRSAYVPKVDGLDVSLVRDGHLNISGPRMSMRQRLPVRAIFNKVLSPNREIPLTTHAMLAGRVTEATGITQLELRDGWVGMSIGKRSESTEVASRPWGIR